MADMRARTSHVTRDSDGAVFQVLGPGKHDGRPVVFLRKPGSPSHVRVTPPMLVANFTAVVLDSEQVTCNGSGLVEDGDAPTSEFNFRGPHDTIGEPPPKPCPGCVNCAKAVTSHG